MSLNKEEMSLSNKNLVVSFNTREDSYLNHFGDSYFKNL